MTNPNKGITMKQADAMATLLGFSDHIEEYELVDMEHVYTLDDGCALIIPMEGNMYVLQNETKLTIVQYKDWRNTNG